MDYQRMKPWFAVALVTGATIAACAPTEGSSECFQGKPCETRGEACDDSINECVPQDLDVDATGPVPAPATFSGVALPFFRGKVCMPTAIKPGDSIPVKLSVCTNPCVTAGSYTFKKQYKCTGSYCDAAVLQYYGKAAGAGCQQDAFARFPEAQCVYADIKASAGPFVISGNAVIGNAKVEIPFLTNDDAAQVRDGASTDTIWALIDQYPAAAERVFNVTMNASNAAAPADCVDESKCECRTIGF
jgi:hypothetical protein